MCTPRVKTCVSGLICTKVLSVWMEKVSYFFTPRVGLVASLLLKPRYTKKYIFTLKMYPCPFSFTNNNTNSMVGGNEGLKCEYVVEEAKNVLIPSLQTFLQTNPFPVQLLSHSSRHSGLQNTHFGSSISLLCFIYILQCVVWKVI